MPVNYRRLLFYGLGVLVVFIGLIFLFNRLGENAITITSEDGSEIFVSTDVNGEFTKIGETKATYRTKQDTTVHFQVTHEAKVSRLSLDPKSANGSTYQVDLAEIQQPELVLESPLKDVLIEGDMVYGISATTSSIVGYNSQSYEPPPLKFIGLPYLQKIYWKNSNDFIYLTADGRVGHFINGRDEGSARLSRNVGRGELSNYINNITKYLNKPIIIYADTELLKGSGIGLDSSPLIDVGFSPEAFLDSDESHIYFAVNKTPSSVSTESTEDIDEQSIEEVVSTLLRIFDYEGDSIATVELTGTYSVRDIAYDEHSGSIVVAGETGLFKINKDSQDSELVPLYGSAMSGCSGGKMIVCFDEEGIWRFDPQTNVLQLASWFLGDQSYVLDSATLSSDKQIVIYTTLGSPTPNQPDTVNGGVYRLPL